MLKMKRKQKHSNSTFFLWRLLNLSAKICFLLRYCNCHAVSSYCNSACGKYMCWHMCLCCVVYWKLNSMSVKCSHNNILFIIWWNNRLFVISSRSKPLSIVFLFPESCFTKRRWLLSAIYLCFSKLHFFLWNSYIPLSLCLQYTAWINKVGNDYISIMTKGNKIVSSQVNHQQLTIYIYIYNTNQWEMQTVIKVSKYIYVYLSWALTNRSGVPWKHFFIILLHT